MSNCELVEFGVEYGRPAYEESFQEMKKVEVGFNTCSAMVSICSEHCLKV